MKPVVLSNKHLLSSKKAPNSQIPNWWETKSSLKTSNYKSPKLANNKKPLPQVKPTHQDNSIQNEAHNSSTRGGQVKWVIKRNEPLIVDNSM